MPYIHPKGSPSSRIWVIADAPLSTDISKGYMFSGGLGFVFDKMLQDAGIKDVYVMARRPDTDTPDGVSARVEQEINNYRPPFIIMLGTVAQHYCEQLVLRDKKKSKTSQLEKYQGSLLTSKNFSHSHYIMPLLDPTVIIRDWKDRNIVTYFDLQKLAAELEFWKTNGFLKPLPFRQLVYKELTLEEILQHFVRFQRASILSVDIESVYTKKDSLFSPHPGYPTTIAIADSPEFGVSFNFFRDSAKETVVLWRELDKLLSSKVILGQNFFEFDAPRLRSLGFGISKQKIIDTKIRHHILWPELSHTLQFMTRQYTREVYYKDEGKTWNGKNMTSLRRYNALDVTVTYEVYNEQELEFQERKQIA